MGPAGIEAPKMPTYVVLLRAVNVGGTGKLPMGELRTMCRNLGFTDVRTYIASGNLVMTSTGAADAVKSTLEDALLAYAGKPVGVLVFTPGEVAEVLNANPFADRAPNRTVAIFLASDPPSDALAHVSGLNEEELALGRRVVYVHYRDGMAGSKLKIPAATAGTARNMNTVAALVGMTL